MGRHGGGGAHCFSRANVSLGSHILSDTAHYGDLYSKDTYLRIHRNRILWAFRCLGRTQVWYEIVVTVTLSIIYTSFSQACELYLNPMTGPTVLNASIS